LVCFRFPLFVSHHAAPVCFSVKHKAHHSWQFTWSLQQLGTLCTLALSWFTHETCDACADCAAPFGEKRFAFSHLLAVRCFPLLSFVSNHFSLSTLLSFPSFVYISLHLQVLDSWGSGCPVAFWLVHSLFPKVRGVTRL
jgi:hypothetical protein